jgi:hypothetical protein
MSFANRRELIATQLQKKNSSAGGFAVPQRVASPASVPNKVSPLVDQQVTPLEHHQLGKPRMPKTRRRPSVVNLNLSVQQDDALIHEIKLEVEIKLEAEIPVRVCYFCDF